VLPPSLSRSYGTCSLGFCQSSQTSVESLRELAEKLQIWPTPTGAVLALVSSTCVWASFGIPVRVRRFSSCITVTSSTNQTATGPTVQRPPDRSGLFYALLAYGAWGLFPLYWKLFDGVPALEILGHRMIWSLVFLLGLLMVFGRIQELGQVLRLAKPSARGSLRTLGMLLVSAVLLACNWGVYIYGVNSDRVVEASLGYFINPLVSVLLGFVFLGERLGRWQCGAVALAAAGVVLFVLNAGQVPWIAIAVAVTFAFYGLLRKLTPVAPMVGLTVEVLWLTPGAIVFLLYLHHSGASHFGNAFLSGGLLGDGLLGVRLPLTWLFVGAGVVTSLPLLWFNHAAKRLTLATLGFVQYLSPSVQFLLGVFWFQEPFTRDYQVMFGFIWAALLLYSAASGWERDRGRKLRI
jgi:chloramphenicol-sensitive protein RarD